MSTWHIFKKAEEDGEIIEPHTEVDDLPAPPPWRDFTIRADHGKRAESYCPSDDEIEMVNAALYLRRPLLITGNPGSGKSSLAYAVARQLSLGKVLWWPINSRSTLREGLYEYDALGRLRDLNIEKLRREMASDKNKGSGKGTVRTGGEDKANSETGDTSEDESAAKGEIKTDTYKSSMEQIGSYIRLGPLGTALYGSSRPRVLLIDEIDKSDIDLPNDLLHVLEEGAFDIPELKRLTPDSANGDVNAENGEEGKECNISVDVWPSGVDDASEMVTIKNGRVQCTNFPFVILTSNDERELPPAFKRRCLRLNLDDPDSDRLRKIVVSHINEARDPNNEPTKQDPVVKFLDHIETVFKNFNDRKKESLLATDQLLSAVYLVTSVADLKGDERERVLDAVFRELGKK